MSTDLASAVGFAVPSGSGQVAELHASALVGAMLQHEASMARCFHHFGVLKPDEAMSIAGTCRLELFDADQLVRETQRELALGLDGIPPLMRRVRDNVELFNPKAAQHVYRCGRWDVLQKNALRWLSYQWAQALESDLNAIVSLLNARLPQFAPRVLRAQGRLRQAHRYGLQLELATTDPVACERSGLFLEHLMSDLGMEALSPGTPCAPLDDWLLLGAEYGVLTQCLVGVGIDARLIWLQQQRQGLESALQRVPLGVAQWLSEGQTLQASGSAAAAEFWTVLWPQWAVLLRQTTQVAQSLRLNLESRYA